MVWQEKRTLDGMAFYVETETNDVSWHKPEALMSAEEKQDSEGEWVWVPHPVDMWQAGRVVKRDSDGSTHVALDNGSLMMVPASGVMQGPETGQRKQVVPLWSLNKNDLRFVEDDLVMLDPVNEAFIINNLDRRYRQGKIYTWVGASKSVLVSINPYQNLPLYGVDMITLHRNKPGDVALEPHVFEVANESYDSMAYQRKNQSILISGESGAGKTEATKQCLKYLAHIAGSDSNVEEKILVANPLLEAFGNAKTIRNINSSRFGKWMEVYFDTTSAKMKGGQIINYLLERSRVVHQARNERNFHIFYQLLKDPSCKSNFNLKSPDQYKYTNQSGCVDVPQINDQREFSEVKNAMDLLEFTKEEQQSILELTAAVLWLGNVSFESKLHSGSVDGSQVAPGDALGQVASLLELSEDTLAKILCYRTIKPRGGFDTAVIPLPKADALAGCGSLAMGIYGKLFNWLVLRVNDSLGETEGRVLGILDIFGFEIFENNSFEQLCINYANEKLQMLFNDTTFREEEQLYRKEGVSYTPIQFIDNAEVVEVIEKKPNGILPVLDDECIIPEGSDQKFMNKIEDTHTAKSCFETDPKRRFENQLSFEIKHYAGVVKYDASAFMVKNVDTVFPDMYDAMATSNKSLLKTIFDSSDRKIKTLSLQFRGQLKTLMETLRQTDSRFIRCVKPNEVMASNQFVASNCVEQLRYSGVFEAVDIRKTGYPFRYTHKQFVSIYSCINPGYSYRTNVRGGNYAARVKEICDVNKQDFSGVEIGNTMALYKANEYKLLKLLRSLALETLVPIAQKAIRGGVARDFSKLLRNNNSRLQEYIRQANDLEGLREAIEIAETSVSVEQRRLFSATPPLLPVAKILLGELQEWAAIEIKMNTLIDKCKDSHSADKLYPKLKKLDNEVVSKMQAEKQREAGSPKTKTGRITYKKPSLSKSQRKAHRRIKELVLDEDARRAVACVSLSMLKDVVNVSSEMDLSSDNIEQASKMYHLDRASFLEAEHERADAVGDGARKKHREVRLLELKYNSLGNNNSAEKVLVYRTPEEFAKAKGLGGMLSKKATMEGMLVTSKKAIPTSLTKPGIESDPAQKELIKAFKKDAKLNFKELLVAIGFKVDKKMQPQEAASQVLQRGLSGDEDMVKEIYAQAIKQATGGTAEEKAAAMQFVSMLVSVVPPSDDELEFRASSKVTFNDSVMLWIKSVAGDEAIKYICALHNNKLGVKKTQPGNPNTIKTQFQSVLDNYKLSAQADDGPDEKNVGLYIN
eukprot:maker-scaffold_2-snap-gene-20.33-mRNA-1 protein AED:0.00 eAED:0.00 QI:73/1/1/1/1/1/2/54/1259